MLTSILSVCSWIPYILDSDLPRNATLGGYFLRSSDDRMFHLYVVRAWQDGDLVAVRQTHARSHRAVIDKKEPHDFVTHKHLDPSSTTAEILTCSNKDIHLRWMKYEPSIVLDSCVPYGKVKSGEIGYVGRASVEAAGHQGSVSGLFVPSNGYITVYLSGLQYSVDVEILCVTGFA